MTRTCPWLSVTELCIGDMVVRREETGPRITQADPSILVADTFAEEICLDRVTYSWITFTDGVWTFTDAFGQRFVYRFIDYHAEHRALHLQWPD